MTLKRKRKRKSGYLEALNSHGTFIKDMEVKMNGYLNIAQAYSYTAKKTIRTVHFLCGQDFLGPV